MKNKMQIIKVLSLCFSLVIALTACKKEEPQQQAHAVPVQAVLVKPITIPVNYTSVAQTEGSLEVEVRARVNGILDEYKFKEGDMVKAGQSLFVIDPRPFKAAVDQAQANVVAAQAQLKQATQNLHRIEPLYKENAVSQKEYDDAVAAENIAKANLGVTEAALRTAKLDLNYAYVYAPISGIIGKSIPSRGSLVTAQQTLLTRISKVNPMYVNFSYSDATFRQLANDKREGLIVQPTEGPLNVTLKLADGTEYPYTGKINFQDIQVSAETSTIPTRAEVPNPNVSLRPGQFVEVTVTGLIRPDAMLVPQRAVQEGEKGKFVFVANKENKAELRWVETGDWYLDQWIINKGIAPNERVITDGLTKIAPNVPVQVKMIPNVIDNGGADSLNNDAFLSESQKTSEAEETSGEVKAQ